MEFLVFIPGNAQTGGPEALHQLADCIKNNTKHKVKVVYFDPTRPIPLAEINRQIKIITPGYSVPKAYSHYSIDIAHNPEIKPSTVCVVPEMLPDFASKVSSYCQVIFWWLSIDNFFFHGFATKIPNFLYLLHPNIYHAAQSKYASDFLRNIQLHSFPLSNYTTLPVSNTFVPRSNDLILYNPAKQSSLTIPLIEYLETKFNLVPIQGYSREQLIDLFQQSKLYLELGNNPGKDRLPREAVANGCLVMSTDVGAGFYGEDTPIPIDYSISVLDLKQRLYGSIENRIKKCLASYEDEWKRFENYRATINEEQDIFIQETKAIEYWLK